MLFQFIVHFTGLRASIITSNKLFESLRFTYSYMPRSNLQLFFFKFLGQEPDETTVRFNCWRRGHEVESHTYVFHWGMGHRKDSPHNLIILSYFFVAHKLSSPLLILLTESAKLEIVDAEMRLRAIHTFSMRNGSCLFSFHREKIYSIINYLTFSLPTNAPLYTSSRVGKT